MTEVINEEIIRKSILGAGGINGREEYLNTAVMVLMINIGNELHFLFQKRGKGISQSGEICFPGGKNDPNVDSDFLETALRECYEELGIKNDKIKILGKLDTVISSAGIVVEAFAGIAEIMPDEIKINNEVEEVYYIPVKWFYQNTPEEHSVMTKIYPSFYNGDKEEILLPAKEYQLGEKYTKPWGKFRQKVYFYKTENGIIWGITAKIIKNLIDKLSFNKYI